MVKIINLSKGKERNVNIIEATFSYEGDLIPLRVNEDDRPEVFNKIKKILENSGSKIADAAGELFSLMSPQALVTKQIKSSFYLSNNMSIKDGKIYFGENKLEETLATHLLSLLNEENTPKDEKLWKSYVRFLDNLFQNANEDIRNQLFRWMDYENKAGYGFAITEDGCIVGYKGCNGSVLEPVSVHSGRAIVDGVEFDGHVPNKVGSVISMPRSSVQYDPSVGCSYGLHVGTRNYASSWAPILLLVKVNPRDVVSVPYECDSQKMRVCEYTVLEVTDLSEEHKMYHYSDEDIDNDFEVDEFDLDNDLDDEVEEVLDKPVESLHGELVTVLYDKGEGEKLHTGTVVDVYKKAGKKTGIIVKSDEDEYKHIKLDEIVEIEFDEEIPLPQFDEKDQDENDLDSLFDQDDEIEVYADLMNNNSTVKVSHEKDSVEKTYSGKIVEIYNKTGKEIGIIVKSDKGEYKHIKISNIVEVKELHPTQDGSKFSENVEKKFESMVEAEKISKIKKDSIVSLLLSKDNSNTETVVALITNVSHCERKILAQNLLTKEMIEISFDKISDVIELSN